jgi:hypothetical protein
MHFSRRNSARLKPATPEQGSCALWPGAGRQRARDHPLAGVCGGLPCVAARLRPSTRVTFSLRFRSPSRSPGPVAGRSVRPKSARWSQIPASSSSRWKRSRKPFQGITPLTRVRILPFSADSARLEGIQLGGSWNLTNHANRWKGLKTAPEGCCLPHSYPTRPKAKGLEMAGADA